MREIPEINAVTAAFPAHVIGKYLPLEKDIPEEFLVYPPKTDLAKKWRKVAGDWFYSGLKECKWKPKEGVDTQKAIRVLQACQGSFEPKHEHKAAGVAYLLSEWFDDVTYEVK